MAFMRVILGRLRLDFSTISIHVKEKSSDITGSINISISAGPAVVIVATLD
jgi:hypothetical protein